MPCGFCSKTPVQRCPVCGPRDASAAPAQIRRKDLAKAPVPAPAPARAPIFAYTCATCGKGGMSHTKGQPPEGWSMFGLSTRFACSKACASKPLPVPPAWDSSKALLSFAALKSALLAEIENAKQLHRYDVSRLASLDDLRIKVVNARPNDSKPALPAAPKPPPPVPSNDDVIVDSIRPLSAPPVATVAPEIADRIAPPVAPVVLRRGDWAGLDAQVRAGILTQAQGEQIGAQWIKGQPEARA